MWHRHRRILTVQHHLHATAYKCRLIPFFCAFSTKKGYTTCCTRLSVCIVHKRSMHRVQGTRSATIRSKTDHSITAQQQQQQQGRCYYYYYYYQSLYCGYLLYNLDVVSWNESISVIVIVIVIVSVIISNSNSTSSNNFEQIRIIVDHPVNFSAVPVRTVARSLSSSSSIDRSIGQQRIESSWLSL